MSGSIAARNAVGLRELEGRRVLADVRCLWLPAWYNSNVIPANAEPRIKIPTGNAHVVFAEDVFALDVDDNPGLGPYQDMVARAERTLSWQSRRGPKAVFRLPYGAPPLQHGAHPYAGLEILTFQALAPGSTKNGHYYPVLTLHPIATIPMELALELAELAPGTQDQPRKSRTLYTVEAVPWSQPWRREQHVRRPQHGEQQQLQATPAALRKRAEWHNETRPGARMSAVKSIALQMTRYGESYCAFKTEILSHPVRKGLEGRGDTDVVLGRVWAWAEREVASGTPVVLRGVRAVDRARPTEAARAWWTHAQAVIDIKCAHLPQRHQNLSDIVRMQASWLQRFGVEYYLPYRVMLTYLDMTSRSALTKYILMLEQMELLQRRHDKRTKQVDGMRWTLLINNPELAPPLAPTSLISSPSFPPSDLGLLSDEEIDWLLDYTRRLEAEAERSARENARSERISQARTRVAAAQRSARTPV